MSALLPVEEAQARCLALARPLGAEEVALARAAGRWLAAPAVAGLDQPPFDAAAMDGYAVAGDPAPGASFRVVGEAPAGRAFAGRVGPGEACRIFTGAPLPEGATRVVIQEDVLREGDRIVLRPGADAARHVRPRGQDFARGATLAAPRRLRAADLALLAAMNCATVHVARRPEVALIATGDELVMPGEVPRPDQIVCSNTFALAAMVEAAGGIARRLPIARDTDESLASAFELARGADLVVTVGGASVGDHDRVGGAAAARGMERAFWKIAMRPGKPLMAGRMEGAAMLGLPGNPVSAIVCGHLFVVPMVRAMQGDPAPLPRPRAGVLAEDVAATGPRTHYMRALLEEEGGAPRLRPFARQDSALLWTLSEAAALLIRPAGDGARRAGDPVEWLPL